MMPQGPMMVGGGAPMMGGGAPMPAGIAREEKRLDHMKANSYEQRRIEGRPNHTLLSQSTIAVLVGSLAMQGLAMMAADWRTNWLGVLGYNRKREWGVFGVRGFKFQTYQQQKDLTCQIFGEFHILAACTTPLCLWYQQKCMTYMNMFYFHLGLAILLILVLIVTALCLTYLFQLNPRSIKVSVIWGFIGWFFHLGCVIAYAVVSDMFFDELMNLSYYPTPDLGFGFYFAAFANLLFLIGVFLNYRLHDMWPEPDSDSEGEEDEDSDDEDGARKKAAMAQQQQMMMMQQQQGMMMMDQQQGMMMDQGMMMGGGMDGGMMPQPAGQMQAQGVQQPQAGMQPGTAF